MRADYAINRAFAYAEAGDLEQVIRHGEYAAESPEPTAGYDFLYARALALSIERKGAVASEGHASPAQARAVDIAVARAEASLAHTLAPESNYVLLAYLSLIKGDTARLGAFASEAVKWDASYPAARWLMAEYYLAQGDRERAAREAEIALSLKPASRRAAKALARAAGEGRVFELTSKKSVERALRLAEAGRVEQAERTLLRALRKSVIPCAECRRALAEVYEIAGSCGKAVSEWQEFMRADASPESVELAQRRIEIAKRRMAEGACNNE